MDTESDLSSLIATRMCHDLASPVGAVANLADMLRDTTPDQLADDVLMLCATAERSTTLLKFFRLVLGSRSDAEPGIPTKTFANLAQSQAISRRVSVEIRTTVPTLSPEIAKCMGLLCMAGVNLVGLRGNVVVSLAEQSGSWPILRVTGEKADISSEKRSILQGGKAEDPNPSLIEFIMLRDMLIAGQQSLSIEEKPGAILLTIQD
ncbi:MAG: hypothetical protein AAGC81_16605 [Pseudomonadota bacterium]